jgi:hypothetical protein
VLAGIQRYFPGRQRYLTPVDGKGDGCLRSGTHLDGDPRHDGLERRKILSDRRFELFSPSRVARKLAIQRPRSAILVDGSEQAPFVRSTARDLHLSTR